MSESDARARGQAFCDIINLIARPQASTSSTGFEAHSTQEVGISPQKRSRYDMPNEVFLEPQPRSEREPAPQEQTQRVRTLYFCDACDKSFKTHVSLENHRFSTQH